MDKGEIQEIIKEYLKQNMSVSVRARMERSMWGDSEVPSVEVEIYLGDELICSYEG